MARNRGQNVTKKNPYRKGSAWMFRWREDVRLADGSPARPEFKTKIAECKGPEAIGKKAADDLAREILDRIKERERRPGSMATVLEFYEHKYVPDVMAVFRKHGQEVKASVFRRHVLPELGPMRLRDVTVAVVKKLLKAKLDAGLSPQTVKHIRNAIGSLYRYAAEERCFTGEIPTSFRWREKMRRVRRRGALSFGQAGLLCEYFDELYAAVPEKRRARAADLGLLVRFLMVVGCRIGEALGLRWRNVNLTAETVESGEVWLPPRSVAIVEAFVRGAYSPVKVEGQHERIVALPEAFCRRLEAHRLASGWTAGADPVFASSRGTPYHRENLAHKHLKPAIAKLNARIEERGLEVEPFDAGFSWHWIRHTHASVTDALKMSPVVRQKILGHSSAEMTMRYSHADIELQRAGLEMIWLRLEGVTAVGPLPGGERRVVGAGGRLAEVVEFSRREVG